MAEEKNYTIVRTTVNNAIIAEGGFMAENDQIALIKLTKLLTSKVGELGYSASDRYDLSVDGRDVYSDLTLAELDRKQKQRTAKDYGED